MQVLAKWVEKALCTCQPKRAVSMRSLGRERAHQPAGIWLGEGGALVYLCQTVVISIKWHGPDLLSCQSQVVWFSPSFSVASSWEQSPCGNWFCLNLIAWLEWTILHLLISVPRLFPLTEHWRPLAPTSQLYDWTKNSVLFTSFYVWDQKSKIERLFVPDNEAGSCDLPPHVMRRSIWDA